VIGSRVRVKVVKNKVAAPFRSAELVVRFGQGIDQAGGLLDLGLDRGLISRTSAGYRFGSIRLGSGREEARQYLNQHPGLAGRLHQQLTSSRKGEAT
jgi:recombination protein RecA